MELLRLRADILGIRNAIEVHLVEDGVLWTHPRVLGPAHAVVEHLAVDTVVCVVAVGLAAARELRVLE